MLGCADWPRRRFYHLHRKNSSRAQYLTRPREICLPLPCARWTVLFVVFSRQSMVMSLGLEWSPPPPLAPRPLRWLLPSQPAAPWRAAPVAAAAAGVPAGAHAPVPWWVRTSDRPFAATPRVRVCIGSAKRRRPKSQPHPPHRRQWVPRLRRHSRPGGSTTSTSSTGRIPLPNQALPSLQLYVRNGSHC